MNKSYSSKFAYFTTKPPRIWKGLKCSKVGCANIVKTVTKCEK